MTSLQITLILALFICATLWLLFRMKNRKMSQIFSEKLTKLGSDIAIHSSQMDIRANALDGYDFQQYNLQEALAVQHQIKL